MLGSADCQALGPGPYPGWSSPDPGGWGCRETLPSADCAGSESEVLGSSLCLPVGSCDRPFPPPEATHFVDDGYPQPDSTHFTSIGAALAAAPAGAVIAIESGTYPESLLVQRQVRLVGRCPEQVKVVGSGGPAAGSPTPRPHQTAPWASGCWCSPRERSSWSGPR